MVYTMAIGPAALHTHIWGSHNTCSYLYSLPHMDVLFHLVHPASGCFMWCSHLLLAAALHGGCAGQH